MLLSKIFARIGLSKMLLSDNCPDLDSGEPKPWFQTLGTHKTESPLGHVERVVQTLNLLKPQI